MWNAAELKWTLFYLKGSHDLMKCSFEQNKSDFTQKIYHENSLKKAVSPK